MCLVSVYWKIIVVIFIIIYLVTSLPIVEVRNGKLEGSIIKTRKGREILAFKGIPYAQPPVGELRFKPPQPAESWTSIRLAKNDSEACLQLNVVAPHGEVYGSEDCLYLNVFTPKLRKSGDVNLSSNYPVMVWIYGGGFVTGSCNSRLFGPSFLLDHDVVLVTINYRLGPLGFLSTADDVISGNQGLKDQVQALRWIHENIAAFGGDLNRVTIFGGSAGGASTHYLMLSPLTKGLIHRVISQSGTSRSPWALATPQAAKSQAYRLAKRLNCPTRSSAELRDCLLSREAADITGVIREWLIFDADPMVAFKPVIEYNHSDAIITEDPEDIIRSGNLVDIPWMTGFTSHEGSLRTTSIYGHEEMNLVEKLNQDFLELAPISMFYDVNCPEHIQNEVSKKIRKFYFGEEAIDESTRHSLIDMYSDSCFAVSTQRTIKDHLQGLGSPVYYWHLAYRGSVSWAPIFGDSKRDHGVGHHDELFYLFPLHEALFPNTSLNNEDERMIDVMTTLWYNFAKTGNPTPEISPQLPIKWKPVRTDDLEYLLIKNSREMIMSKNLWSDRMQFWENLPCKAGLSSTTIEKTRARDEL